MRPATESRPETSALRLAAVFGGAGEPAPRIVRGTAGRPRRPVLILLGALVATAGPAAAPYAEPSPAAAATRPAATAPPPAGRLPWREAGLDERQAAAHLLDRLTYGPRPGEVDRVLALGLEAWLAAQLAAARPEPALEAKLAPLDALDLSLAELGRSFPPPAAFLIEARRAGVLPADVDPRALGELGMATRARLRRDLLRFAAERGYRRPRELVEQLAAQKLYRAVYAENQLAEVLTGFWFDHFNVSITDNDARIAVLPYERDAIRPHALGRFRDLLGATARHPAMLYYLDNARSVAAEGQPTTVERRLGGVGGRGGPGRGGLGRGGGSVGGRGGFGRGSGAGAGRGMPGGDLDPELSAAIERNRPRGLNENYARELLELHTLGVDGGYGQDDVVAVARAFTGWSALPPGFARRDAEARLARLGRAGGRLGFVVEDGFVFRADAHDAAKKTVLGRALPAGRGIEDGEEVLDLLAAHPATARHLAEKLAVRLVSDHPPERLVERLAATFTATGGDLRAVVEAAVYAPEFWAPEARRAKIKSPLELAASAVRGLGADLADPRPLARAVADMGQPLYAYQAPTGYPDRGEFSVNTGALLQRMNFGLRLAAGAVPGVEVDLPALTGGREPESRRDALAVYGALLLPGRDLGDALARLAPVAAAPGLAGRVSAAAPAAAAAEPGAAAGLDDLLPAEPGEPAAETAAASAADPWSAEPEALAQVVGVLLGSPEYQRR